ncbi:exo-rhamnogalacturonan lyase family protein [Glycomyces xiaoerkulensis]|uniref:exo-rhamnogalacturonan lyase family protein n=1 Tax=Glycomyces xiaoerkulensis TaxID=2038139 RepID=UPI000C2626F9|nr:Tat pathway signal sequence domain protein [Glycomyces xiaoerkulensis]
MSAPSPDHESTPPADESAGGLSRRNVLATAAGVAAATSLVHGSPAGAENLEGGGETAPQGPDSADLTWLEGRPAESPGSTWGVPWGRGRFAADQRFRLVGDDGADVPVQTWPLAHWPDGSLKWTGHAIGPDATAAAFTLGAGEPAAPSTPVTVSERRNHIDIDTGVITARIATRGSDLIKYIKRGDRTIASGGHLVNITQSEAPDPENTWVTRKRYTSEIDEVAVEQDGPVRAVVRVEGHHRKVWGWGKSWLPFTVRLYFYSGGESFRMVHTFIYDSDGSDAFIAGLGVRFKVALTDELYDRHVRFVGEGHGQLTEAVKGLTGLRRDPGEAVRTAQVAGRAVPGISEWDERVSSRVQWIPAWGDYSLSQLTSEGFAIRKRTKTGHGWVPVDQGRRASGFAYLGGPSGGFGFGMKDFWQRHPTGLDIRDAHTDQATVTLWMWSPEAQPMDTRFYHDGMGLDNYEDQLDALNVTYEDYEPGFGTPEGVARTTELQFWATESTPSRERLGRMADVVRAQPQVIAPTEHMAAAGAFGGLFGPVDRSHPVKEEVEDNLDFYFDYYRAQVDERHWYGFWDFGDVMHSQDGDRMAWRYDVGGYAWDNSEISPDMWLWQAYLHNNRADVFRFAEAMTRKTSDVNTYHLGEWAGLGTRHGVQHWGDSAKQVRISNANYRRYYYYLTADERTGDLLHLLANSEETFLALDPIRKIRDPEDDYVPDRNALSIGFGTDWGALVSAWLTEWERRGPDWEACRQKVLGTMETIAAQPSGFAQGSGLYDMDAGRFAIAEEPEVERSNLSNAFGRIEICAELIQTVDMPAFEQDWLRYSRFYTATREEQEEEYGGRFADLFLYCYARANAFVYARTGDRSQAEHAWHRFRNPIKSWEITPGPKESEEVESTLNPSTWHPIATNEIAQWGQAAVQILALAGDFAPEE